jgi:hypothetical protein
MAETVFAGKQVEEFPLDQSPAVLAPLRAIFARLAKDFFVRHRPRDAGDGHGENEQPGDL